ncbi:MAG TPA: metallophosphoesterase [Polyangia bacterium]|jgi:3',5'-cyclic AMP phosphodiesterase CpdA
MTSGLTRRDFLVHGTAAALLAGLWPGRGRAGDAPRGEAGDFDFIAVNDLHFADPRKCPPWFDQAFDAMKVSAPKAELVLVSGDLSTHATEPQLGGLRECLERLKLPVHVTPGNHDVAKDGSHALYDRQFPTRVNYAVEHRGWQFFHLNSAESRAAEGTRIPPATLRWLDDNLKKFDPRKPTVISTHFPLGPRIVRRPRNADDLLRRFERFNLRAIFNGHWHGQTQSVVRDAVVTTDRCCSRRRGNHDGSPLKGWFVCEARAGTITRRFASVPAAPMKPARPRS